MKVKIIIFQSITIIVLAWFLFSGSETEVKVVEKVEVAEVCEYLESTKPKSVKKVYTNVQSKNKVKTEKKKLNEYTYEDDFNNGKLTSVLLVDGNIADRNVNIQYKQKTITREITKTKFKPSFYIAPGITMHKLDQVKNTSLNGFIAREKTLLGAGVGVDIQTGEPTINATIGFRF